MQQARCKKCPSGYRIYVSELDNLTPEIQVALQVESPMNNVVLSVLICGADTDTVSALLMGSELGWEVAFGLNSEKSPG